jgi:hypothetical protein
VEYADLDDDRDHDAHSDLRRQPPGVAEGDHGPQQEPEQIAGKQQRRHADAGRAEPSRVRARGQDQRQQAQGQDAMRRDGERQGQDRDHRDRQDQHADDLIPGLRVLHGYRRRQLDDAAQDHGEDQQSMIGRHHPDRSGRPGGRWRRRPQQRPGEVDEEPLRADRARDGHHRAQDGTQPVEARVGPHQPPAQPAQAVQQTARPAGPLDCGLRPQDGFHIYSSAAT